MTHDERWNCMWQSYMNFVEKYKRCPSKYIGEERPLVNWAKHCRQLRNKGILPEERLERFKKLSEISYKYRRINQYAYLNQ